MIVVTRLKPNVHGRSEAEFLSDSQLAIASLAAQPGCAGVTLGASVDEPGLWLLHSIWDGAGSYRRALSSYEVKLHTVPFLYQAIDEPSAYEERLSCGPDRALREHQSELAGGQRGDQHRNFRDLDDN